MSLRASVGFSVEVVDEDGTQQLHVTEVKADSLASAKGRYFIFNVLLRRLVKWKSVTLLCQNVGFFGKRVISCLRVQMPELWTTWSHMTFYQCGFGWLCRISCWLGAAVCFVWDDVEARVNNLCLKKWTKSRICCCHLCSKEVKSFERGVLPLWD